MNNSLWLITMANVLYLASYSVHDILWLRILSVLAGLLLIPYYLLQPVPLVDAARWNVLFIAINFYWIVRLMIERRPVRFTPDEERLKEISFPSLTSREARALFAMGMWVDVESGSLIGRSDRANARFSVILRGAADVLDRGTKIGELGEGQFVGIIDEYAEVIDVEVLASVTTHLMCWPRDRLSAFLESRPDVALALERSIGFELRQQLDRLADEMTRGTRRRPPGQ